MSGHGDGDPPRDVSEAVAARRDKLRRWREMGVDPFGRGFKRTHRLAEVREAFDQLEGSRVAVAGRLVALRRQGRVAFANVRDRSGDLQLFLRNDAMGAEAFERAMLLDLGDFVAVEGEVMRTRAGEVSVCPSSWRLLTKALRPLPDKWHGLRDTELRYRQRYLDLAANPASRDLFIKRSRMISAVRRQLESEGFLEVETPVLHAVPAGAAARPFVTHHNALGRDLYLRIALELHLKRLIVGGLDAVYEIGRVFRNEGVSTRHNPEFTMLECYQAYADYHDMMDLTERLFAAAATATCGGTKLTWQGRDIDLAPPWRRLSMVAALAEAGVDVLGFRGDAHARAEAERLGVAVPEGAQSGKVIDELCEALVLPRLIQPTFLIDHPVSVSPLARARPDDPRLALRFEPVIGGIEMGNAFTELNDPDEQRLRFRQQAEAARAGDTEAQAGDEEFVRALEHGMPPTGGLGVGLDRMAMLLCDAASIREVILFPHLRGEAESPSQPQDVRRVDGGEGGV